MITVRRESSADHQKRLVLMKRSIQSLELCNTSEALVVQILQRNHSRAHSTIQF